MMASRMIFRAASRITVARPAVFQTSLSIRCLSATPGGNSTGSNPEIPTSLSAPVSDAPIVDAVPTEVLQDVAVNTLGYAPVDLVMSAIENTHQYLGIPYWETIMLLTVGLRICLLPVSVKAVINGARMAVMRPHMQRIQDAMVNDPKNRDRNVQTMYQTEMKQLFKTYKVNPFQAMLMPLFQIPIFVSVFMALRTFGEHFSEFTSGGAYWFVDLTAADPTYIMPIYNAITFLAMIELGADGLAMEQKNTFKNVMRGVSVLMVPLTASMPAGVFVYWSVNNTISILQTTFLKSKAMKKIFDIPDAPANDSNANLKIKSPIQNLSKIVNEIRGSGDKVIVDGSRPNVVPGPPPVTFPTPPNRRPKSQ